MRSARSKNLLRSPALLNHWFRVNWQNDELEMFRFFFFFFRNSLVEIKIINRVDGMVHQRQVSRKFINL